MLTSGGSVVVVGHGHSLKGARLGEKIDACGVVIRLKNCSMLLCEKKSYGRKTDVMCSSTEVLPYLAKVKAKEYWGYPKKGSYNKSSVWNLERKVVPDGGKVIIPLEVCNLWNCFFLELGGRHTNVSTGLAAVIIALDRLKPQTLYLAGFDNVMDPNIKGYKCTVPTLYNKNGTKDTGHDWQTENRMLPYLALKYGTEIRDLAGKVIFTKSGKREKQVENSALEVSESRAQC
jgi:hypothetical protein